MGNRLQQFFEFYTDSQEDFIQRLWSLAELETPTGNKELLDSFAAQYARVLHPHVDYLDIIEGERGAKILAEKGDGECAVLILLHMDTVWPVEADNKPPLSKEDSILRGPGVLDMKASLVMTEYFLKALEKLNIELDKKIIVLATPDEERGSQSSVDLIKQTAKRCDFVLCAETPLPNGDMKIRRKGVGMFRITVEGKESHAGVNPWDGVNAIHELSLQIAEIMKLDDDKTGTTVNVCQGGGGTASNVIPGSAWATVDFRAETLEEAEKVTRTINNLKPKLPGAKLVVSGGINRPPLEKSPESERMADIAEAIANELGHPLGRSSTGGGSDGSFTAAIGVPTLDGIGIYGTGAHTPDEHVVIDTIAWRTAMFSELIFRI